MEVKYRVLRVRSFKRRGDDREVCGRDIERSSVGNGFGRWWFGRVVDGERKN
jgi:hypothetical protein